MIGAQRTPTAGLRGAFWTADRLPEHAVLSVHPLRTADGQSISGYLLATGRERVVAVIAHPREHLVAHYLAAEIVRGGTAVFLPTPRLIGNDIRLEHEIALFDLAAAMTYLRCRGYDKIVAIGNSGGGPLWAFYNQQALARSEDRVAFTPGGRPTNLATASLPVPDGIAFISAHLGQGKLLMNLIDPSVTDEGDAFSVDPSLDPFDPANGYAADGEARYAPEFVTRYRAAQVARVARIDAIAREHVARRAAARRRLANAGGSRLDAAMAAHTPVFPVWRTDADLRCWDMRIDPSDRHPGSLWGSNPAASNYGSIGFGRICTPESWLSTWSGLVSNASMERCAPAIEQPALLVEYTGDASTFPGEVDSLFDMIGTPEKERVAFAGDHHGRPLREGVADPKEQAGDYLRGWISEKFGATTVRHGD